MSRRSRADHGEAMTSHLSERAIEAGARALRNLAGMTTLDINDAQIREAVRTVLTALSAEGFAVVPVEPTAHQIAAALPTDSRVSVDEAAKKIGAAAVMLLLGGKSIPTEGELVLQASYLVQDYRAMIQAANGGDDAGK